MELTFFTVKIKAGGLANGTYTITVKAYVDPDMVIPEGAKMSMQPVGKDTYGPEAGTDFTTTGAISLTTTFTVGTDSYDRIRVKSNEAGKGVSFYIDDVLITGQATGGAGSDPSAPPAETFKTIDFEDGTAGGFTGREGKETLTVTNEANHTKDGSNALKIEGRTQNWGGPSLNIAKYVDAGSKYNFSLWVRMASPASAMVSFYSQVGDSSYNAIATDTSVTDGDWVQLKGSLTYNSLSDGKITIYVQSADPTASFYIDDVSMEKVIAPPIVIQKDLTPIKDVYKDDFLIGNAIAPNELEGTSFELLKQHFNVITAGNDMKPESLQKVKGVFTFSTADAMIQKAHDNGMQVHGHVLVWHSQTPAWMNTKVDENGNPVTAVVDGKTVNVPLSREEALQNMETHIRTVVEHFGSNVISWDVVNEAMSDGITDPSDWRKALRKDSMWYQSIGDDYVDQAFLITRKVLDENGLKSIKLYYNDYNEDDQNKSKAIANMVQSINSKYGKIIDGIGMQAHYSLSTKPENVKASLERFINCGVEVSVSELDIQAGGNSVQSEDQKNAQAYLYAQLMKIYREHAADISRVTVWGLDDGVSWRKDSCPLLFDAGRQAKAAYYAVVDPDKYLAEHEPPAPVVINHATAVYGTPVIDGTVDSVWGKAAEIPVNQTKTAWQLASGKAKALWDNENLYVLIEVNDNELDKTSANPWEQDSVEAFVDENNGKTASYEEDDGQYRVNYDNEASFNPSSAQTGFASATSVAGTNYIVEMKIPFKKVTPAENMQIGFDAQINDAKNGARDGFTNWNDTTGVGYKDTSVYGILTLTGKGSQTPGDTNSPSPSSAPSAPSAPDVRVSVDGSYEAVATANTYTEYGKKVTEVTINDSKIADKLGQKSTVTLRVTDNSDVVIGQLNAQTLKTMAAKEDTLEIKTGNVTYTLPASRINIPEIASDFSGTTDLKDIKVTLKISGATDTINKMVQDTAGKTDSNVIVKPVIFEINCSNGGKNVEVSKFNGFVERTIAIP
ncbi:MAG TPA: endo-1,4-beta-xylanase, partial [Ruminiclostridium sp.]|nr:endo-1,4-beta-xylanase [Ruminiclostridium sp.]